MRINGMEAAVFPAGSWHGKSKKITAENAVQRKDALASPDTDAVTQDSASVLDIYYRMRQTGKAARENYGKEQPEAATQAESPEQEESETKTEIIVKPDGSRVLVITTLTGGLETTMSLEIAKPQEEAFCPEGTEAETSDEIHQETCLSSGGQRP